MTTVSGSSGRVTLANVQVAMGTTRRDTRARLGCKAEGCQPIVSIFRTWPAQPTSGSIHLPEAISALPVERRTETVRRADGLSRTIPDWAALASRIKARPQRLECGRGVCLTCHRAQCTLPRTRGKARQGMDTGTFALPGGWSDSRRPGGKIHRGARRGGRQPATHCHSAQQSEPTSSKGGATTTCTTYRSTRYPWKAP